MGYRFGAILLATAAFFGVPTTASGFFGVPGCINLPEYQRAVGALQGMTGPCDMTVEYACRVMAERGIAAAACERPVPRRHRDRQRRDRTPRP